MPASAPALSEHHCCWPPVTQLPPCLPPDALALLSFSGSSFAKSPASFPFVFFQLSLPARPRSLKACSCSFIALCGEEAGQMGLEGKGNGGVPLRGWGWDVHESVTSALIRASGAFCLPAAVLYVGRCTVAALCPEESGSSQNLDSPSAKAKDDCFIGLCLQVGPCSGHQIPCGDFRDPEGGKRGHLLVCTMPGGSPSLSLHHCHQGVADQRPPAAWEEHRTNSRDAPATPFPCHALGEPGEPSPPHGALLWWRWASSSARPST